jgi:putative ABC transport system substrate-binding protein
VRYETCRSNKDKELHLICSEIKARMGRVETCLADVHVQLAEHSVRIFWRETEAAAQKLGVTLQPLEVCRLDDFEGAFADAKRGNAQALLVFDDSLHGMGIYRIVNLATSSRLPAIYASREFPVHGGLMSYGPNVVVLFRRAATFVDKILKGAKPADLPVEQPTKFELVVNLRTAKALGLTVPPSLLADEVIE